MRAQTMKRQAILFLLAIAALGCTSLLAADGEKAAVSERAQVLAFLKKHVMGKTLRTPRTVTKSPADKIEDEYQDQEDFHNLVVTDRGFSFDLTTVGKDTWYDLDKDGQRIGPAHDYSGTTIWRFEFGERASTKRLTGVVRLISTTVPGLVNGGIMQLVTNVKLAGNKLTWRQSSPGYMDFLVGGGKFKPGSFDDKATLALVDGKLQSIDDAVWFDVDPDTLKRTPFKD